MLFNKKREIKSTDLTTKRFLTRIFVHLFIIVNLFFLAPFLFSFNEKLSNQVDIEHICRLDDFPPSRKRESYQVSRGLFGGSVSYKFNSPSEQIHQWIARSPGLRESVPEKNGVTTVTYHIRPTADASYCYIYIDSSKGEVLIDSQWS